MNENDLVFVGLDPLFNVDVKLFIKDIYALAANDNLKGFFKFYQHAIQNAEICGYVVAVEQRGGSDIYTVDDGTGTIECIFEPDAPLQIESVTFGDCIRVSGKINEYRDNRELRVHALSLMGPNDELMHNVQVMWLKKQYQKQVEVPAIYRSYQKQIEKQLHEEEIDLGLILPSETPQPKADTAAFCDALLNYLKTRYQTHSVFSPTAPITNENLKVLAKEAMINTEYNANPTVKQISQFFYQNLKSLESEGYIVQTDQKGQLYKIVDEEHLKDIILRVIQEVLSSKENYIGGVLEEYIVSRIQSEDGYEKFPSDKVLKLLEEMAYNSIIYTCASGEYKII